MINSGSITRSADKNVYYSVYGTHRLALDGWRDRHTGEKQGTFVTERTDNVGDDEYP